jgi:lysine 2,3-aminomutase
MARWKEEIAQSIRSIEELKSYIPLTPKEEAQMERVVQVFPMQIPPYYLGLIDLNDPRDPIRQLIIPSVDELSAVGKWDTSGEALSTRVRGLQHKYLNTALFLLSDRCAAYCRFCFRKRLFHQEHGNQEIFDDHQEAFEYLENHPEIDNVLLSGGDALMASADKLDFMISRLWQIPHLRTIRLGTKVPAFLPFRITEDEALLRVIAKHSSPRRRLYVVVHYEHVRELTDESVKAIDTLLRAGAVVVNQTVLVRAVNDRPRVLRDLFNELCYIGATPYYLFQCRPVKGTRSAQVPLEEGCAIFEEAKKGMSGLAKRAKYCMSHQTGKIEILGVRSTENGKRIFLKYHQARRPDDAGRIFARDLVPGARWLDELQPHPRRSLASTIPLRDPFSAS